MLFGLFALQIGILLKVWFEIFSATVILRLCFIAQGGWLGRTSLPAVDSTGSRRTEPISHDLLQLPSADRAQFTEQGGELASNINGPHLNNRLRKISSVSREVTFTE